MKFRIVLVEQIKKFSAYTHYVMERLVKPFQDILLHLNDVHVVVNEGIAQELMDIKMVCMR